RSGAGDCGRCRGRLCREQDGFRRHARDRHSHPADTLGVAAHDFDRQAMKTLALLLSLSPAFAQLTISVVENGQDQPAAEVLAFADTASWDIRDVAFR